MDSAEHQKIAEKLTLHYPSGPVTAGPATVLHGSDQDGMGHAQQPVALSYGQVLSLGGDFYGMVNQESISLGSPTDKNPATMRFKHAFQALNDCDRKELATILKTMQKEIDGLAKATAVTPPIPPDAPSAMYAGLGDSLSFEWNTETGGGITHPTAASAIVARAIGTVPMLAPLMALWAYAVPLPRGRYLMLASSNWDHFGSGAIASYRAGHALACWFAARAASGGAKLEYAYMVNAFADHFLTDLFSAGHLRVPRKPLQEASLTSGYRAVDALVVPALNTLVGAPDLLGGMLAKKMHDEDGKSGLSVRNARGDQWTAYGDGYLFDAKSATNLKNVRDAVQTSIDEVWAAYNSPKPYLQDPATAGYPCPMAALKIIPDLADVNQPLSTKNPAPLFIMDGQTIKRRADCANPNRHEYISDWTSLGTLALLGVGSYFPG